MHELPLQGVTVVDVTRMLPGAVLARNLVDLGADVIKVEDPRGGDPMRATPPLVDGVGVGFCVFYRGARSVTLDLRRENGQVGLRRLLQRADVFVESFRPGTLDRWGLGFDALRADLPGLVCCALPGFPAGDPGVGHDLNFTGLTGLLEHLPGDPVHGAPGHDIPRVQFADVIAGLLATSAIVAALLRRARTGEGAALNQPLLSGPLPLLTWALADRRIGEAPGAARSLLSGRLPSYRIYRCGDEQALACGCLEPKFWIQFCAVVGRPELAAKGLDFGDDGQRAAAEMERHLRAHPRAHWLDLLAPHGLPVSPVLDLEESLSARVLDAAGLLERTPLPGGSTLSGIGPLMPGLGRTPATPAPRLGADNDALLGGPEEDS